MTCPTCGGELAAGRTYCSRQCLRRRGHYRRCTAVPEPVAEQYPAFDLSVLTEKQCNVVVMRLGGSLPWRVIGMFEGTTHATIMRRYARAIATLRDAAGAKNDAAQ
jgi:hypothetical protein